MKDQSFISLIVALDQSNIESLSNLIEIQKELENRYSDYEILVITQHNAQAILEEEKWSELKAIPCIRYIQLSNDVSTSVALSAGLENSIGDFILFFDLANDPIFIIHEAVEKSKAGHDVIIGISESKKSLAYYLLRPFVALFLLLADYRLPKNATSFRCLTRRVANAVMATGLYHNQIFMRIQKTGYPFTTLPYAMTVKQYKSIRKSFLDFIRIMVFNSVLPLRLISFLGFGTSVIACIFALAAIVINFLRHDVVEGWTSTLVVISMFAAIQFVILAFISEYINRLLAEQSRNDSYSIVYEKNSTVMIDQDRINVFAQSESSTTNKVQTGRRN